MPKQQSPLAVAAGVFDDELAQYARLGELFIKTPLTTLKHLERANSTLGELAACEQRLQDSGKQLVQALAAARERQEQLARDVVAYAPTVQARNQRLGELMTALAELAQHAAQLNAKVAGKNGDAAHPAAADAADVSASVLALSTRAEALAKSAHDAEFEELASQAHALHQRLLAIGHKLQKAAGS